MAAGSVPIFLVSTAISLFFLNSNWPSGVSSTSQTSTGGNLDRKLTKAPKSHPEKFRPATSLLSEPPTLDIWTFDGFKAQPYRLFSSVELQLNLSHANGYDASSSGAGSEHEIYQSPNRSALFDEQTENRRFFGIFRKVVLWKSRQIPPFQKTFVGIETTEAYEISVKITAVDYIRLGVFAAGIFLFFFAKSLARNAVFYYTSGAGVGVLASLLIVVFVVYKFLPRRSMAFSVLIGGWSFSLYLLYCLWQNLYSVLMEYQKLAAAYLVTVLLISFGVCYRFGPLTDPRSQNLSQWGLQIVGLVLMYAACQITDITIAAWVGMLVVYNMPASFYKFVDKVMYRLNPPKPKLLTEEEYIQQGADYTKKALEELRTYCRSPKCDAWKITSRLESPTRFASFISGQSHLDDDEILNYDSEPLLPGELDLNPDWDDDEEEEEHFYRAYIPQERKTQISRRKPTNFVDNSSADSGENDDDDSADSSPANYEFAESAPRRNPHVSRIFRGGSKRDDTQITSDVETSSIRVFIEKGGKNWFLFAAQGSGARAPDPCAANKNRFLPPFSTKTRIDDVSKSDVILCIIPKDKSRRPENVAKFVGKEKTDCGGFFG